MASELLTAVLGALQASVSVLLTIGFGVVSAQYNLLSEESAKHVSTVCVKLFLPSLLLVNIGSQLSYKTEDKYIPIIIWALLYNFISIGLGLVLRKVLKLPAWTTPAITFNNSISMPLLLLEALGHTNILNPLLEAGGDELPEALSRAKSFFLVNSMIADSLTFGIGARLLGTSDSRRESVYKRQSPFNAVVVKELEEEEPLTPESRRQVEEDRLDQEDEQLEARDTSANEESSLLPKRVIRFATHAEHRGYRRLRRVWDRMPKWLQNAGSFVGLFINAPLIGTLIGVCIALIPALKTAFFADAENGGIFNAWLTSSVKNVGDLFPALQVVVVGVKLRQSLHAMKMGEEGGTLPWQPLVVVLFGRFVLWPAVSIPLICVMITGESASIVLLAPMSPPRRPRFADNIDDDDNDAPDDPRSHRSHPPPTPQPLNGHGEDRPAPNPRRKSILVDPSEDPRDRQQRRERSNSRVRVKPPPTDYHSSDDEGTIKGSYVRHRNGQVEFVPDDPKPKRRAHDLEKKTGDGDRRFRERRDGYESDEGEQLKSVRKRPPRDARDSIGDVDDGSTNRPSGRSRHAGGREDGFVLPDRTRGGRDPRDDRDDRMVARRRYDAPPRGRHDSDLDDEYDPRSRRRPPPQRGPDSRRDRGYDSEGPSRRRRDWDDDNQYSDRRRSGRYDDYPPKRPDYRQDRRRSQPRPSKYDDDPYDRRERRRDEPPVRRARSDARRDERAGGKNVWANQAGALFTTYAMPVIKREGGKWARKQLESYMGQQGGR
ncbi:MAG: hypothetical protein Q9162_005960 [Coniocarpon cinnabarinum]